MRLIMKEVLIMNLGGLVIRIRTHIGLISPASATGESDAKTVTGMFGGENPRTVAGWLITF